MHSRQATQGMARTVCVKVRSQNSMLISEKTALMKLLRNLHVLKMLGILKFLGNCSACCACSVLPCASTVVEERAKSSIAANKKLARAGTWRIVCSPADVSQWRL